MSIPDAFAGLPARSLNSLYLCKAGSKDQVAMDVLSQPVVDKKACSVMMVISTDALDRDKMFIRQSGIMLDYYRLNPVVLYGHGIEGIVMPVASAWDKDKNLQIFPEETQTLSKAFHSPKNQLSMQIFDAVDCGLLRAASVGITPVEVGSIFYQGSRVPIVEKGMLNEWSYCAIGVNPETVLPKSAAAYSPWVEAFHLQCDAAISILNAGKLNGETILPSLVKSFTALVPTAKRATRKRVTMTTTTNKLTLTKAILKSFTSDQLLKACAGADQYDEKSQAMLKEFVSSGDDEDLESKDAVPTDQVDTGTGASDLTPAGDDKPAEKEGDSADDSEPDSDGDEEPASGDTTPAEGAGATALTDTHEKLQALLTDVKNAFKPVEKDDVKKDSEKIFSMIEDAIAYIEGIFSKCYPDNTPLTSADPSDSDAAAATGDLVKAFRANDRNPIIFRGLSARIGMMAKSNRMPAEFRKSLAATASAMGRMEVDAMAVITTAAEPEKKEPAITPEDEAGLSLLEQKLDQVMAALENRPAPVLKIAAN